MGFSDNLRKILDTKNIEVKELYLGAGLSKNHWQSLKPSGNRFCIFS